MIRAFLLFSFLGFICICIQAQSTYKDERTGIPVSFITDTNMYPKSWRHGKVNGEATALNEPEYERSKLIVARAMEKYPAEILTKHLKKIYVLDEIRFYGLRYGGTNSIDAVYISNKGLQKGYTDHFVEQLFHAEFSSILLRNLSYYLNKTNWVACNAPTFVYGLSGVEAMRTNNDGENFDEYLHEQGLLTQYATSNFENDVNSFAKNIFMPKQGFWDAVKKYPRLRCKLDLLLLFYIQINPLFTEIYFRNMDK